LRNCVEIVPNFCVVLYCYSVGLFGLEVVDSVEIPSGGGWVLSRSSLETAYLAVTAPSLGLMGFDVDFLIGSSELAVTGISGAI
jgi:hypothetical protein